MGARRALPSQTPKLPENSQILSELIPSCTARDPGCRKEMRWETPKLRGKAITSSDGGEPEVDDMGPGCTGECFRKIVQMSS